MKKQKYIVLLFFSGILISKNSVFAVEKENFIQNQRPQVFTPQQLEEKLEALRKEYPEFLKEVTKCQETLKKSVKASIARDLTKIMADFSEFGEIFRPKYPEIKNRIDLILKNNIVSAGNKKLLTLKAITQSEPCPGSVYKKIKKNVTKRGEKLKRVLDEYKTAIAGGNIKKEQKIQSEIQTTVRSLLNDHAILTNQNVCITKVLSAFTDQALNPAQMGAREALQKERIENEDFLKKINPLILKGRQGKGKEQHLWERIVSRRNDAKAMFERSIQSIETRLSQ
ncbi:hypothetical protein [Holospora curviuscula]|uniref:Uncharacterized protein n=1 Tax=Holospora curviuscula TaxID=1082868 RepID=A0A2S5RHU4_9PROT|nr:hypothetical protein [Holospora curviuscula]PPE06880.1 hypothetical protein HCUR_00093 [Holospora curviuscula]